MTSVQRAIKIYARLKPSAGFNGYTQQYEISLADAEAGDEILKLSTIKNTDGDHIVNNKPECLKFRFSKVFDRPTTQDCIFNEVARPVINSCLQGYNGTVFAYGQTGSGKTHTMTGSRSIYEARGIIPRTIQYIFQQFNEDTDASAIRAVFISYLEIYNESGYDLLHSNQIPGQLEDLVKVVLLEDGNQQIHLKNLSVHPVNSVEEATQLLYLGEVNRAIAETPMNEASTRSHCIFTIHMNIREANSSIVRRSKLHLVDLAGSERVSNSSITGQLLTEARHINLALHYLEQVIVALSDSNRTHIPYRNSMMTSVLRDSLGGNCMTTMIATLSLESRNAQETISTCRFAQRVAMVTNDAIQNEELDPNLIIANLRNEVKRLKGIIGSSSVQPIQENSLPLTADEKLECSSIVEEFLRDCTTDSILPILPDMRMIQHCFSILKIRANEGKPSRPHSRVYGIINKTKEGDSQALLQTIARRDAEIKVLVDMLRKERQRRGGAYKENYTQNLKQIESRSRTRAVHVIPSRPNAHATQTRSDTGTGSMTKTVAKFMDRDPLSSSVSVVDVTDSPNMNEGAHAAKPLISLQPEKDLLEELSEAKRKALNSFMESYHGNKDLEDLRNDVTLKTSEYEAMEKTMLQSKANMNSIRGLIEKSENSEDMDALSSVLTSQQRTFNLEENRLESKRDEIWKVQNKLTNLYKNLMNDFESWWIDTNQTNSGNRNEKKSTSKILEAFSRSQVETMNQTSSELKGKETKRVHSKSPRISVDLSRDQVDHGEKSPRLVRSQKGWTPRKVKPMAMGSPISTVSPRVSPRTTNSINPIDKSNRESMKPNYRTHFEDMELSGNPTIDEDIKYFFRARQEAFRMNINQK